MPADTLLRLERVSKVYRVGAIEVRALAGVSLQVSRGEFLSVMGSSGSGKSTLLTIFGCLTVPTEGEYWLDGQPVSGADRNTLAGFRSAMIGFVFQQFHLLPRLTAAENVEVPMVYMGVPRTARGPRARELLGSVGLGERADHLPSQLSGGEQQRVAIARALANKPQLLLADEPTGNLDSRVGGEIMDVLIRLNREGVTVVLVTHHEPYAQLAHRTIRLHDGHIAVHGEGVGPARQAAPAAGPSAPVPAQLSRPMMFPEEERSKPDAGPQPPAQPLPFDF